ncbi:conserved hypothetical protein [Enhydrobacter sp. AX1]|nr:hypothetical protein [Enhydrobacter sp. AX1]VXB81616.1 conserved hypothetical protein [Enhydrobacter sp. AX1]
MADFQSDFVFGLKGKRYQDFVDSIARPIVKEIIGTDDYEFINFEHHLSYQDFANTKNSIVSHIYNQFLNDIKKDKETGKVSFKKKVCISLDDRLCTETCLITGRKITAIKLAGIELAYFIYFDMKEFYDFVYNDYTKVVQDKIITITSVKNVKNILSENSDFDNISNILKSEINVESNSNKNQKSTYKSFAELAVLRKDKLDDNQIESLNNQNDNEFKEITGYIHNHNYGREFSFIRVSSDDEEGYRVWHIDFPDIKELREGTPVALILEKSSFNNEFTVVDFKPCCYEDLNFVKRFKGTLKKISISYAIIKSESVSIIVPYYLIQNLDEDKIYDVECVAIESYDRKKEQMGWQALEFYILG